MLLERGPLRFLFAIVFICIHEGAAESSDDDTQMLTRPSNLKVIEGATVILPCDVPNQGRLVRLWKQLPSRILFSGTIMVSRDKKIHLVNGSSLRIDDITPEYAGEYVCWISQRPLLTVTHRIQVIEKSTELQMLSTPSNFTVKQGATVVLPCEVINLDRKVRIWKHLPRKRILFSGIVSVHREEKVNLVNGSSLRIDDITPQYSGEYECTISRHPSVNVIHRIEVLVPKTIEQDRPDGKIIVPKGNAATMTCNVSGISNPLVTWSHEYNGVQSPQLPSEVREVLGGTQLQIESADVHHEGLYMCTAQNDIGELAAAVFNITVLDSSYLSADSSARSSHSFLKIHIAFLIGLWLL